jgi:hypothetical protein
MTGHRRRQHLVAFGDSETVTVTVPAQVEEVVPQPTKRRKLGEEMAPKTLGESFCNMIWRNAYHHHDHQALVPQKKKLRVMLVSKHIVTVTRTGTHLQVLTVWLHSGAPTGRAPPKSAAAPPAGPSEKK